MDAALLKKGLESDENDRPLVGITFADYLRRLDPPAATRELFSAWWTVSGSGAHDRVAAAEFLSSCLYGGGLADDMVTAWTDTVSPGMAVLAERMIAASGAELRLDCPVSHVADHGHSVTVASSFGRLTAQAAVIALGVNQLSAVTFEPALSPAKATAAEIGHGGKAIKIWVKARGVDAGTFVTGGGAGIELAFAERTAPDGTVMIAGFGIARDGADPGSAAWVGTEIRKLFPNAEVVGHDWHDWNTDPYARGTWVAAPVEPAADFTAQTWAPEGRRAFASSDIAREHSGWFEAAIISGEDAAAAVDSMLSNDRMAKR